MVHTAPFADLTEAQREEAAIVLMAALARAPSAWHDIEAARAQVASCFENPKRLGFAAIEGDRLVGWIGAIRHSPHAFELHPLVVGPDWQRRGVGRLLVAALEEMARAAGATTIWLGTDDDFGGTSLFGKDLYPDVLNGLQSLRATAGHPFTFYQRLGFQVVGVLPDVDGPGCHDILMAKRIG